MKKKNKKQIIEDEEYVPKAFRKNKEQVKDKKHGKKSNNKKEKKTKRKFKKIILIICLIIIIISGIALGISSNLWKTLAKEMLINKNSIVLDIDGNEIAKLRL